MKVFSTKCSLPTDLWKFNFSLESFHYTVGTCCYIDSSACIGTYPWEWAFTWTLHMLHMVLSDCSCSVRRRLSTSTYYIDLGHIDCRSPPKYNCACGPNWPGHDLDLPRGCAAQYLPSLIQWMHMFNTLIACRKLTERQKFGGLSQWFSYFSHALQPGATQKVHKFLPLPVKQIIIQWKDTVG